MINICYCGNGKLFEGLALSVMSVANHTNVPLNIIIATMDLTQENPAFFAFSDKEIEMLDGIVKKKNAESQVTKLDLTQAYKTHLLCSKNHKTGFTPFALLRLLLDLDQSVPDKVLYLDIDTMALADISCLFDIDISDKHMAATPDHFLKAFAPSYINSGVLLLNMQKIREDKVFENCRNFLIEKKLKFPDQSALNKFADKLLLPREFNEQRKIRTNTVIKHFANVTEYVPPFFFKTAVFKQWEREKLAKRNITVFDDYYKRFDALKSKKQQVQ